MELKGLKITRLIFMFLVIMILPVSVFGINITNVLEL